MSKTYERRIIKMLMAPNQLGQWVTLNIWVWLKSIEAPLHLKQEVELISCGLNHWLTATFNSNKYGYPNFTNRLATTQTLRLVIDAMRKVAPTHVFVACDGPKPIKRGGREGEITRMIENEIDWPCKVEDITQRWIKDADLESAERSHGSLNRSKKELS